MINVKDVENMHTVECKDGSNILTFDTFDFKKFTKDEYKKHLIRMCIALTKDDNIYRLSPEGILENRRLLFDIMDKLYIIDNEGNN
jgi:hypothetical protein